MARQPRPRSEPPAFDQLHLALTGPALELAGAANRLIHTALPHGPSSRAWTRVYGVDKMLAWKIMRLCEAIDLPGVLGHLPGRSGLRVLVQRLRQGGCDEAAVAAFERAALHLWDELESRRVTRNAMATLAAGALDSPAQIRARLRDRRAMRLASERIWGVSAAVRVSTYLLAPARTPDMISLAMITIMDGLRIHRRGEPWCVFSPSVNYPVSDPDLEAAPPDGEVVSGADESGGPLVRHDPLGPLISEHCDDLGRSAIALHPTSGTRHLYLDRDRVPLSKPMRVVFGEVTPLLGSAHASTPGELGMINSRVVTPVATLVLEVMLHRDLPPPATDPTALCFMKIDPQQRRSFEKPLRLPVDAEVFRGPVHPMTKLRGDAAIARRHTLDLAASALRTRIDDYECHRLVVADPILGSTISLRWRLPMRG